ncbi:MAG TPA: TonB-dependent receptor [Cytophagales bacterium]|nr:TonB-dependent receptor [Cytophagales bacterium]
MLGIPTAFSQDTGTIKGTIKTADGKSAQYVNVGLKGTSRGATTDPDGSFEIKKVEPGNYILVISFIGLETREQPIKVTAGEVTQVSDITLKENLKQLQEVVISSNANRYSKKESEFVAKLPLKNLENPQVYNTISAELLKDQVITNFDEALKNATGLDKRWESTGRAGDGAGYFSLRGFSVQPTMINGLPGLTNGGLDPANIERIEVLKGPSGTLYGSSLISYGGLINIVTKKPYQTLGGEISYNFGSFGLNRITADVNTPLSKEKDIALRVNTAYHSENSFQDAGFKKSIYITPSVSYKVNDRLSFLVNTEFLSSEGTNPAMLFLNRSTPLVASDLEELNYNNKRSYTSNDVTIKNPTFTLQGQMKYKLSDKWYFQTVLSRGSAKADGYYSYLWDFADGKGTYGRYISKQNSTTLSTDIQQNFVGDFSLGTFRNRIVAGVDYFQREINNANSGYILFDAVTIGGNADPSQLSLAALDTAISRAGIEKNISQEEIFSAYVSDVINISPQLSAMLSIRLDRFNNKGNYDVLTDTKAGNYSQTALSPKLGLIYQPIKDKLSVFANYMNGFTNVAPITQGQTFTFKPEQANQWEVGVKTDLMKGRLSGTFSYYNIRVSNIVLQSLLDSNDPNSIIYNQGGENYSRGLEASIIAAPIEGLNIIAGYSYNESKVNKTDNPEYENRRPEAAGPQHMINGWISYKLNKSLLKGLGIGFGGNYASEYATIDRASTGTFYLPEYAILNSSIFYDTEAFRITLKVNNLTNKEYYQGWSTINPQKPRNIIAGLALKF